MICLKPIVVKDLRISYHPEGEICWNIEGAKWLKEGKKRGGRNLQFFGNAQAKT
jgi:hypothetical protein